MATVKAVGDDFEYQGYLLFNGVFKTEFIDSDFRGGRMEAASILQELLPEYKETDQHSDEGYVKLLLSDALNDASSVPTSLSDISTSLIPYRYAYEDREDTEAYYRGDQIRVQVPNVHDTDLYWTYPNYMFLRGSKGDVKQTRGDVRRILDGKIHLNPVSFDGDFLLWLFYRHTQNKPIPGGLQVEKLTDTKLTGDRDAFGETNQVDDSTNLRECVPMLAGVLKDKSVSMLEGYFELYDDYRVKAQIGSGRVHVKASQGDIQTSDDIRRMAISLNFLQQLMELHDEWIDLDPQDKFPPRDFFRDLYETAKKQGVEIDSIAQSLLTKYSNKRDEDWS